VRNTIDEHMMKEQNVKGKCAVSPNISGFQNTPTKQIVLPRTQVLDKEMLLSQAWLGYTVPCESLGTPCRICENVNNFNKIRGIIQNACYFLFSTVLSKIFYMKDVYM